MRSNCDNQSANDRPFSNPVDSNPAFGDTLSDRLRALQHLIENSNDPNVNMSPVNYDIYNLSGLSKAIDKEINNQRRNYRRAVLVGVLAFGGAVGTMVLLGSKKNNEIKAQAAEIDKLEEQVRTATAIAENRSKNTSIAQVQLQQKQVELDTTKENFQQFISGLQGCQSKHYWSADQGECMKGIINKSQQIPRKGRR